MIKLTFKDGGAIYLNPTCIESFFCNEGITYVRTNYRQFRVKETPKQILSMINETPLKSLVEELLELDRHDFIGHEEPYYNADEVWKIVDKYIPEEEDD